MRFLYTQDGEPNQSEKRSQGSWTNRKARCIYTQDGEPGEDHEPEPEGDVDLLVDDVDGQHTLLTRKIEREGGGERRQLANILSSFTAENNLTFWHSFYKVLTTELSQS